MTGLPVSVRGVSARVVMNKGGCGGYYAYLVADFEPPGPDGRTELVNLVPERRLPAEFLPAVRAGIELGLDGVAATVRLTDGGVHEVDAWDIGYRTAGAETARAALVAAGLRPAEEADALRWATWPGRPRRWPGHNPRSQELYDRIRRAGPR
uniref:Translation elongation factor EFG/EF2 domain-containing protein n=1 Tax=Streptomyces sp. NBC_00049 TaxID=2903617 RepID=A0AAU2JW60_9ACTN